MQRTAFAVPALLLAGIAAAQEGARPHPADPAAKAPPVAYRSALDGYRPFAEQELGNWRKFNDEVGAAGGHRGHLPGAGAGDAPSKPQAGKNEGADKDGKSPAHRGHGGHK